MIRACAFRIFCDRTNTRQKWVVPSRVRAIPMSAPVPQTSERIFVLKPDEIGDFVLTTGCLRRLAEEFGEDRLILAVSRAVAPLAQSQFPTARVLPLEFRRRRKILNVTMVNIGLNFRVWMGILFRRVRVAACFRSLRSYLHTFIFYSPRAGKYVACENLLGRQKRNRRPVVEKVMGWLFRPVLRPYPEMGARADGRGGFLPTDLEANRLVASEVLGRELTVEECWPVLRVGRNATEGGAEAPWVLAPFSSSPKKDYPAEGWAAVLRGLEDYRGGRELRLCAAPYQRGALEKFRKVLDAAGVANVVVEEAVPLPEYVDFLAGAACVLTVDTATAHFACALRRPALIVSAGHHPGVYGPYSPDGRQLWLAPKPGTREADWVADLPPEKVIGKFRDYFSVASFDEA